MTNNGSPIQLDQFLQDLGEDGVLESEGEFSLEFHKAVQKIGQFSLPRPAAWILLIVQAAVAGGCEGCDFALKNVSAQATMAPDPRLDLEKLAHLVWKGTNPNPAEAAMALLLKVALSRGWTVELGSGGFGLRVSPEGIEWLADQVDSGKLCLTIAGLNGHCDEYRELLDNARFAPLRLTVDGTDLPTLDSGLRSIRKSRGEIALSVSAKGKYFGRFLSDGPHFHADPDELNAVVFVRGNCSGKPTRIHWIQHGVVIDSETLYQFKHVYAEVSIEASDLPTDITGFRLRETDLVTQRRGLAIELLHTAVYHACQGVVDRHNSAVILVKQMRRFCASISLSAIVTLALVWGYLGAVSSGPAEKSFLFLFLWFCRSVLILFAGLPFHYLLTNFCCLYLADKTGLEDILHDLSELVKRLARERKEESFPKGR